MLLTTRPPRSSSCPPRRDSQRRLVLQMCQDPGNIHVCYCPVPPTLTLVPEQWGELDCDLQ